MGEGGEAYAVLRRRGDVEHLPISWPGWIALPANWHLEGAGKCCRQMAVRIFLTARVA